MGGGRSGPGQHRPAPLVRSSSGEVWRLQPEPPLRRVSAQGVEDLGQELARHGHVPQRVGEALHVDLRRVSAQGVEDLGQELARHGHVPQRVGEKGILCKETLMCSSLLLPSLLTLRDYSTLLTLLYSEVQGLCQLWRVGTSM